MDKVTILQIFDLDETFFRMPGYTSKKHVEKEDLKFDTPYSFYDHPASLCEESHNIQLISPVYDFWKQGFADPEIASVLITHRVAALENKVSEILEKRGIEFDKMFFLGRKTDKVTKAEELLAKLPHLKEIRVFEDSIQQLDKYQSYFNYVNETLFIANEPTLDVKLYIVDKSKMYRIQNFKLSEETRIKLI